MVGAPCQVGPTSPALAVQGYAAVKLHTQCKPYDISDVHNYVMYIHVHVMYINVHVHVMYIHVHTCAPSPLTFHSKR